MRKIAVLGSTGSIGRQTLDECERHPDLFQVTALTANSSAELLFEQIRKFRPEIACLTGGMPESIPEDLAFCRFYPADQLENVAADCDADDLMVAVVGVAGLRATLAGRRAGKRILLANKETLVAGGHLVMDACRDVDGQPTLIPVDSEHSAIWQCLQAAGPNRPKKILLTASGGPFRTWSKEAIENADCAQALRHPTWNMGSKITVDSASMFNKALEIIEAKWLFNVEPEQIKVLVHPQSIVHSMIAFEDGAVLAQLGVPDMRVPILYAMTYPERVWSGVPAPDFAALSSLTFEAPDPERFPALRLAYQALSMGGAACAVLNAANEVAAQAFLSDRIRMGQVYRVVAGTLDRIGAPEADSLEAILEADRLARITANEFLKQVET
ncbi:MAG: 1-deoxy-D-xylulose-5-phosphate reductoisomerase [Clostridia bacterium]|nr:1-deoxy-D-xylulose-5-phosphate reductoisomerase [Clostridia bacterium]